MTWTTPLPSGLATKSWENQHGAGEDDALAVGAPRRERWPSPRMAARAVDDRRPASPSPRSPPTRAADRAPALGRGGLDLAVYEPRAGRWYYLRHGGQARNVHRRRRAACPPAPAGSPEPVASPGPLTRRSRDRRPPSPPAAGSSAATATPHPRRLPLRLHPARLDGTLVVHPSTAAPPTISSRPTAVYDARQQAAPRRHRPPPTLSSSAVARIDDATRTVHVLGYAHHPRRRHADGRHQRDRFHRQHRRRPPPGARPTPAPRGRRPRRVERSRPLGRQHHAPWSRPPTNGRHRRGAEELLESVAVGGKERMAPWDDRGSVLMWSFDGRGGAEGHPARFQGCRWQAGGRGSVELSEVQRGGW